MLAALMLSMGITLTFKDFRDCLSKPVPVAVNFVCCYVLMPALAFSIGTLCGLSSALMAGLVLVGSINGGQARGGAKGERRRSIVSQTLLSPPRRRPTCARTSPRATWPCRL